MKCKYKSIKGKIISCLICQCDEFDKSSIVVEKDNGMCSNNHKYIVALECVDCSHMMLFESVEVC